MKRTSVFIGAAAASATWWQITHRSSPAVRGWRPSGLPDRRVGPLHVRAGGDAGPLVVLLHGFLATGDVFGAAFDPLARTATVVVPDLLGFGRSLDETRSRFSPDDHLDALDDLIEDMDLGRQSIHIGAHSMGAAVAMRWAQRRGAQVQRIVCWGPPVYSDVGAVDRALADSGLITRLFVADTWWARAACRVNCRHRRLAGILATMLTPSLPVAVSRAASLHTWPAYRDAMDHLIADTDWDHLVGAVSRAGTSVRLVWGSADRIGDPDYARSLSGASVEIVRDAGHRLPMTHGHRCVSHLRDPLS